MNPLSYVDIFYGNLEPDLKKPEGIAANWFYLKAQTGNTHPGALLPFGMVSACAYTGGYSSGYGPYWVNSYARPPRIMQPDAMEAMGFSHFHHSGTGYIDEFYNYFIFTPVSGRTHARFDRYPLRNEAGQPGYYACTIGDITAKVSVTDTGAVYEFEFAGKENALFFDPEFNGLSNGTQLHAPLGKLEAFVQNGEQGFGVSVAYAVKLHAGVYCAQSTGVTVLEDGQVRMDIAGKKATLYIGFSFAGMQEAQANLETAKQLSFAQVKEQAAARWEKALSTIEIDADDEAKEKFYSNYYHSLIKPVTVTGNSPFWNDAPCCVDLATMWDVCKVQLPLLFTLFEETGSALAQSMVRSFAHFGKFPNCLMLTPPDAKCDMQARALTVGALYDAYLRGVEGVDWNTALESMAGEILRDMNEAFVKDGIASDYPSHTIDLAVASQTICDMAKALGRADLIEKFAPLAQNWKKVYNPETGMLVEDGKFYEGCNLNYSFRLLPDMEARIALCGGKEAFERALDAFFGYGMEPAKQCLVASDVETLRAGQARRGFEGFNNETDMETPYAYCYIGRADKTIEIIRGGEEYMYGTGKGAMCGNDDSGGLSSTYVANALGVFPVTGQDLLIVSAPSVRSATLHLRNGKTLAIATSGDMKKNAVPKAVYFGGKKMETPFMTVTEFMQGGELKFEF